MAKEYNLQLIIYDRDLRRQGVIDVFRSLIWMRKYYECGTFELHVPLNEQNIKLLSEGNIISKREHRIRGDIVKEDKSLESGIIEGIAIDDTVNEITATGRFLSSLLDRRVIESQVTFSGTVEEGMRHLIGLARPLPFLNTGFNQGFPHPATFQISCQNLYEYICKLSKYGNLGFRIRADYKSKSFYFEVYEGVDRSEEQRERGRVTFTERNNNLNGVTYVFDSRNLRNRAIVTAEGEGGEPVIVEVGDYKDLWDLREIIVDARGGQQQDLSSGEYIKTLKQRGLEALNGYGIVECVEANTKNTIKYQYKENYDLGDIVTVHKRNWGIRMHKRITEVQEIYEDGGFMLVPTFGDPLPEKIDLA